MSGHGHSHTGQPSSAAELRVRGYPRVLLVASILVAAVLTGVGLVALWPSGMPR